MDNLTPVKELFKILLKDLQRLLNEKFNAVSTYIKNQSQMAANQAVWIASERAIGSLRNDDQNYEFFVSALNKSSTNFVRSLAQMTLLTIEELWNTIVGTVWDFLNGLLGQAGLAALPVPRPS